LMPFSFDDTEVKSELTAFVERLQSLGWMDGGNIRIDYRWAGGDIQRLQAGAKKLVDLKPDILFACAHPPRSAGEKYAKHPDRLCGRVGSGWRRLCQKPRPARGQRDRFHQCRGLPDKKMARASQAGRTRDESGGASYSTRRWRREGALTILASSKPQLRRLL